MYLYSMFKLLFTAVSSNIVHQKMVMKLMALEFIYITPHQSQSGTPHV